MARLRTQYKSNNKSAENIPPVEEAVPQVEVDGVKAEPVAAVSIDVPAGIEPDVEPDVVARAIEEQASADRAKSALVRQLTALRESEALQRQHLAQLAAAQQQPPNREQLLHLWKSQGMHDAELEFLQANPELIDIPELTSAAAAEATRQGHQRGSESSHGNDQKAFPRTACPNAGAGSGNGQSCRRAARIFPSIAAKATSSTNTSEHRQRTCQQRRRGLARINAGPGQVVPCRGRGGPFERDQFENVCRK